MADRHMSRLVEEIITDTNNPDNVEEILKTSMGNINNTDSTGRKPIFYCVDTFDKSHKNYVLECDSKKWPRLVRIAEILMKHRVELNLEDRSGWTLLHEAARHGDFPLIQLLLRYGVECLSDTKKGQLPAEIAFSNNHKECAVLIDRHSLSLKRQCRYAILNLGLSRKIAQLDVPTNLKLFLNYQNPYDGFKWSLTPPRPFTDIEIANENVDSDTVVQFIGCYASNRFVEKNADVLSAMKPRKEALIQVMNQLYATGDFIEVCYDEPLPRPPRYTMEKLPPKLDYP